MSEPKCLVDKTSRLSFPLGAVSLRQARGRSSSREDIRAKFIRLSGSKHSVRRPESNIEWNSLSALHDAERGHHRRMSRPGRPGRFIWRVICGQFYVRSAKSAGGIALDVKLTLVVTSAESAGVPTEGRRWMPTAKKCCKCFEPKLLRQFLFEINLTFLQGGSAFAAEHNSRRPRAANGFAA